MRRFFSLLLVTFFVTCAGVYSYGQEPVSVETVDKIESLEERIAELESALGSLQPLPPIASEPDPKSMRARWGPNGFEVISNDESFRVHVGGRVQVDGVAFERSDLVLGGVGTQDAVDFRRARIRVDGTMYENMTWAAEFDFVNGQNFEPSDPAAPLSPFGGNVGNVVAPTDLWFALNEVPYLGVVRIGNQKEPIGMEHLCSSRFLDFMERSYLQDAFYGPFNNGFTPGLSLLQVNEATTVTASLGIYKNVENVFAYNTGNGECALTGRLTCVPLASDDDARLLHLGCAVSLRGFDQENDITTGNLRIRSRASLRNGPGPLNPHLADTNFTGRLFVDNETLIAPEIALVYGPWLWQSEYVAGFINNTQFTPNGGTTTDVGQVFVQGQYVEVLYFLTGEHRYYERYEGRFGRVKPHSNMVWNRCGIQSWGAWQVGIRYGFLDLNDGAVQGGYIQDLTVGLNWFFNPFSKVQFNYVHEKVDNIQVNNLGAVTAVNDGSLDGFGVRFAFDF